MSGICEEDVDGRPAPTMTEGVEAPAARTWGEIFAHVDALAAKLERHHRRTLAHLLAQEIVFGIMPLAITDASVEAEAAKVAERAVWRDDHHRFDDRMKRLDRKLIRIKAGKPRPRRRRRRAA